MGGFPNLASDSPRNAPNKPAKTRCHTPSSAPEVFRLATCGGADGFCPTFITDAISTNQPPAPALPEHSCGASVESVPSPANSPTLAPAKSVLLPAHFPQPPEILIIPILQFEFRIS